MYQVASLLLHTCNGKKRDPCYKGTLCQRNSFCQNAHHTMKITINSITPVYSWHWSVPDDELCGICRISFDGTCPNCLYPGDSCPLTIGTCNHAFHLHCIEKWLQQSSSRGLCPMCRQAFTTDESLEVNKGIVLPNSIIADNNVANNSNGNRIDEDEEAQLLS